MYSLNKLTAYTLSAADTLVLPSASLEDKDPIPTDGNTADKIL